MSDLITLIDGLRDIEWNRFEESFPKIERQLRRLSAGPAQLLRSACEMATRSGRDYFELSKERTTHFKWFLYHDKPSGFRVWLHQYKERRTVGSQAYAEVPHNHLYWFTSLVLGGGFDHCKYIERDTNHGKTNGDLELAEQISISDREIYSLHQNSVHQLTNFKCSTATLVVQSPNVKEYSESFIGRERKRNRHYTLENQYQQFLRSVGELSR